MKKKQEMALFINIAAVSYCKSSCFMALTPHRFNNKYLARGVCFRS